MFFLIMYVVLHEFIHSSKSYLLSAYYITSAVLGAADTIVNETDQNSRP